MSTLQIANDEKELILTQNMQKLMWKLSLPSILAMILFGLNTLTDAIFVGQLLGKTALAGVALANPFNAIMLGFGYWIGTGAANVLSISLGNNDTNTQQKLLPAALVLAIVLAAVFTLPVYYYAESLIGLMGGKGEVLQHAVSYFRVCLIGSFLWIYGMALNLIIRGEGKMKEPAVMVAVGLLVNIILTPILIKVFGFGVEGAAWATNAGMLVFVLIQLWYFVHGKSSFDTVVYSLQYDKATGTKMLQSGLPAFLFNIMALIQSVVVFHIVNKLGTDRDIAFYAATNVIYLFLMTPLYGLMRAFQPVAGINFGAGQKERIKKGFAVFTVNGILLVFPLWMLVMIFPDMVIKAIVPDLLLTISDISYFRVYLFVLPFLPLVFIALSLFPAVNKSNQASIIVLGRQLLLYIPAMLLLPQWFGMAGIYYGSTLVNILIAVWTAWVVRKELKNLIC